MKKGKTRNQEIVGVLLYYSRVIDSSKATAVNMLSEQTSAPTEATNIAVQRLIDYCRLYPNNYLIFTACDMILRIQSDASYLSAVTLALLMVVSSILVTAVDPLLSTTHLMSYIRIRCTIHERTPCSLSTQHP